MARNKIALIGAGQAGGTPARLSGLKELGGIVLLDAAEAAFRDEAPGLAELSGSAGAGTGSAGGAGPDAAAMAGRCPGGRNRLPPAAARRDGERDPNNFHATGAGHGAGRLDRAGRAMFDMPVSSVQRRVEAGRRIAPDPGR